MAWIKVISYEAAKGNLKRLYDRLKGPTNHVDNVMTVHSLRPHTLKGHMALYKSVLHHHDNTFPKWYLETIGTYVSQLNNCAYCVAHHSEGLKREIQEIEKAQNILQAIQTDQWISVLDNKLMAGISYAKAITVNHKSITQKNIQDLKESGLNDGEILEINQVACYFNYVNRMVMGLGVDTQGDILGLSPKSEDSNNWSHQ